MYKIGDEIWWFQAKDRTGFYSSSNLVPDSIQLVHDVITSIADGYLICWHGTHRPYEVWGKTRQQAWDRLKNEVEKWGTLG